MTRRPIAVSVFSLCCVVSLVPLTTTAFLIASPLVKHSEQLALQSTRSGNTVEASRTWAQHPSAQVTSQSPSSPPVTTTTVVVPPRRKNRRKITPMPVTGYDSKAIEEFYDRRPLQVGWRLNSLGFPLLGWYLGLLADRALGIDDKEEVQRRRGKELRGLLVHSGSVALIKSGQALSLRPDLIRNKIWAEELGKLVDAVGSFPDIEAMDIIKQELSDLAPRLEVTKSKWMPLAKKRIRPGMSRLQKKIESNGILSLFEFFNDARPLASASIGQVYKARIRPGPQLVAAVGEEQAARWGGKIVAIKVQRPDAEAAASLDMYLLRRTAMWLSMMRGGDLPQVADCFGMQLFGELDYVREANNCDRFRALYADWEDVFVPEVCSALTRQKVLVMEWVDGEKGPWDGQDGIDMVSIGLRCSVDQLMTTGLFHADPHRGNLLKTPEGKLALIDFGMVCDIDADFRYSLFGLVIGLQNKNLPLVTENLLKDTTQLDLLIPRLRRALKNATGGTGKASDVNFSRLQAELDAISRENVLRFSTPPFFTVIIRSLTILEGVALSVDPKFRLVRGAYPYVLNQLLIPEEDDDGRTPAALQALLVQLLTVNGNGEEIEWVTLRDFLSLAQKASKKYDPRIEEDDTQSSAFSRKTISLFAQFLTSRTGIFLKKPLVHELAEAIDGMASMGEANLLRLGVLPELPGMNGPINTRRMDEIRMMLDTFRAAMVDESDETQNGLARMEVVMEVLREVSAFLGNEQLRKEAGPVLEEVQSVIQMVAVEVLEIRGTRAIRKLVRA